MNRYLLLCTLILMVVLTGCSEKTYEPREMVSETDVCKICNMSIVHEEYAGQIALKNGDYEVFDDLGCLIEFIVKNGKEDVGGAFIKDAQSDKWVDLFEATYVYNKDYWTPMNYGVVAFETKEAADEWMEQKGEGQLLVYEDLLDFKWGIHH